MEREVAINDFHILHIELKHVATLVTMPFHHRDPFDRLLLAQSKIERIPIVSDDTAFDAYPVTRLW
jgi:PIN domain nuclease of toxin-antitoxin system